MNNKSYIGSSVDLKRRFLEYFNIKRLLRYSSMAINKALLKYGYSQFSLSILEYCDELMIKEKYYLLSPKYNILKEPGSPSRGSG
jgi:group I intron endonuclease